MRTHTIWRPCDHCGVQFSQPNDPGRKRRYCTDACKQAAYRLRKRQQQYAHHEYARRAQEEEARRQREEARRRERQERAREEARRGEQRYRAYQPPPYGNGYRTETAEQARIRRIIEALLRKAAATTFPHEAAACRAKAEELRRKHGL